MHDTFNGQHKLLPAAQESCPFAQVPPIFPGIRIKNHHCLPPSLNNVFDKHWLATNSINLLTVFRTRYFLELSHPYGFIPHSWEQLRLQGRTDITKWGAVTQLPRVEEMTSNTPRVFAEQCNTGQQILLHAKTLHGISFKHSMNASPIMRALWKNIVFQKVLGANRVPRLDDFKVLSILLKAWKCKRGCGVFQIHRIATHSGLGS